MKENLFIGILQNPTKTQLINIESNWKFIYGGLKLHKEKKSINKYGIIHLIRQIDGYYKYKPTKLVKNLLINNSIAFNDSISSSERTKINKQLKNKGINDYIQIEHLNGGLKSLVNLLIEEFFNGKQLEELKEIHKKKSLCCYKLYRAESSLNENSSTDFIDM